MSSDFIREVAGQSPQDVFKPCFGGFQRSDQAWVDAPEESCNGKPSLANSALEVSIFSLIGGFMP